LARSVGLWARSHASFTHITSPRNATVFLLGELEHRQLYTLCVMQSQLFCILLLITIDKWLKKYFTKTV